MPLPALDLAALTTLELQESRDSILSELRARGRRPRGGPYNPAGRRTATSTACSICLGLRPPQAGAEPWRCDLDGRFPGTFCKPCEWGARQLGKPPGRLTDEEKVQVKDTLRLQWPHWGQ